MVMKMAENINALDEINKGSTMGIDAISMIIDKVEDKKLKKILEQFKSKYEDISLKITRLYPKYDSGDVHKTNIVNKVMTDMGIEMKTFNDTSNSKIAEILLQGVNMGIIEGKKILNKKKINTEVESIVSDYVSMQEEMVEVLKTYL